MRVIRMAALAGMVLSALLIGFLGGTTLGGRAGATRAGDHPVPAEIAQPMADFWRAYDLLNQDSYWAPLDKKKLVYAAINGMLSGGTGDAHTIYLSPQETLLENSPLNGGFDGIGAYVDMTSFGLVLNPLKGSPAMKAGLRAKDVVTRVNGVEISGMSQEQVIERIRGKAGTTVRLTITRPGVPQPFVVVVTRGRVIVPSVTARMYGQVAYLQISEFGAATDTEVIKALKSLLAQKPRGLVIDLRDNPGGLLNVVVTIASQFLPSGPVVWEQKNDKTETALYADGHPIVPATLPLAVLVNHGSASASEILAGALQDDHRATIVGTQTFGKGSVQELVSFDDGASARITIRLWRTPHQHLIQGTGIAPNILIEGTQDPAAGIATDKQLQRAFRALHG